MPAGRSLEANDVDGQASPGGSDPTSVINLDDLARELGLLRARAARGTRSARVSLEDLAARVGEPKSTIHAYLTGRRLAPSQVLDRIVIALGTTPAEQREWAEAWYRVSAYREAAHRVTGRARVGRSVVRQLPLGIDSFTGRDGQLAELDARLGASGGIVAVCGTAGVGKTALAVHWAQRNVAAFPDGQLYLDLRGFDLDEPVAPSQALAGFLRALGVPDAEIPGELAERAACYRSLLAGRRMLILLDNARDVEQLRPLLPGTPSCAVLVTSRDNLTALIVRHGAHRLDLDVFSPAEAAALLRRLLGPSAEADQSAALAERCARLPLALGIAAELASSGSLAELVAELTPASQQLDLLDAGDDSRTAIRSVFGWSYQRLAAPLAHGFRLAGLAPGADLSTHAFAALSEASVSEAARTLGLLSGANLIRHAGPARFSMHRLLRVYARELGVLTDPEPARWLALTRLLDHYLHTAAQAVDLLAADGERCRPELPTPSVATYPLADAAAATGWLDRERANLLELIRHAGAQGWPWHAIRLAQTVAQYFDGAGRPAAAERTEELAQ